MTVIRKFFLAELLWTLGILMLLLPVTVLGSEPLTASQYMRWLSRALILAAFPAGIAIAAVMTADPQPRSTTLAALLAAVLLGVFVLFLNAVVVPLLGGERRLMELARAMTAAANDWETRNDAAWWFFSALFAPVQAVLFAAIGVQVGIWAPAALPPALRRLLYWIVALGLVAAGYTVSDSTYEVVVLHTNAFVDFAAFYTLLVPAGICAGLALPTLALLRGGAVRERGGGAT